jgi:dynein heavy chain
MLLDDHLMKIQAMNASPFVKPFREEATKWEATLMCLQVGGCSCRRLER